MAVVTLSRAYPTEAQLDEPDRTMEVPTTVDPAGYPTIAWQQAAIQLFRKHYSRGTFMHGKPLTVFGSSYFGSERPYGTYHRQFSTGHNLSETFIINVSRGDRS